MSINKEEGKNSRKVYINFRLQPEIRNKLRLQSKKLGVTMTEIIERKIIDSPLVERSIKNERFVALHLYQKKLITSERTLIK